MEAVSNLSADVISEKSISVTWMVYILEIYIFRKFLKDSFIFPFSQPPPPSSRPPVIGYKISHNVTGSEAIDQTNDTTFTVDNERPGVYLFSVLAVNVLGEGLKAEITTTVGKSLTKAVTIKYMYMYSRVG